MRPYLVAFFLFACCASVAFGANKGSNEPLEALRKAPSSQENLGSKGNRYIQQVNIRDEETTTQLDYDVVVRNEYVNLKQLREKLGFDVECSCKEISKECLVQFVKGSSSSSSSSSLPEHELPASGSLVAVDSCTGTHQRITYLRTATSFEKSTNGYSASGVSVPLFQLFTSSKFKFWSDDRKVLQAQPEMRGKQDWGPYDESYNFMNWNYDPNTGNAVNPNQNYPIASSKTVSLPGSQQLQVSGNVNVACQNCYAYLNVGAGFEFETESHWWSLDIPTQILYFKYWVEGTAALSVNATITADASASLIGHMYLYGAANSQMNLSPQQGAVPDYPDASTLYHLAFTIGPIPVFIDFSLPVFLQWQFGFQGTATLSALSMMNANILQGNAYVSNGCTMQGCIALLNSPDCSSGNWCPINSMSAREVRSGPYLDINAEISAQLTLIPILKTSIDGLAAIYLAVSPALLFKASASVDTTSIATIDAKFDFSVQALLKGQVWATIGFDILGLKLEKSSPKLTLFQITRDLVDIKAELQAPFLTMVAEVLSISSSGRGYPVLPTQQSTLYLPMAQNTAAVIDASNGGVVTIHSSASLVNPATTPDQSSYMFNAVAEITGSVDVLYWDWPCMNAACTCNDMMLISLASVGGSWNTMSSSSYSCSTGQNGVLQLVISPGTTTTTTAATTMWISPVVARPLPIMTSPSTVINPLVETPSVLVLCPNSMQSNFNFSVWCGGVENSVSTNIVAAKIWTSQNLTNYAASNNCFAVIKGYYQDTAQPWKVSLTTETVVAITNQPIPVLAVPKYLLSQLSSGTITLPQGSHARVALLPSYVGDSMTCTLNNINMFYYEGASEGYSPMLQTMSSMQQNSIIVLGASIQSSSQAIRFLTGVPISTGQTFSFFLQTPDTSLCFAQTFTASTNIAAGSTIDYPTTTIGFWSSYFTQLPPSTNTYSYIMIFTGPLWNPSVVFNAILQPTTGFSSPSFGVDLYTSGSISISGYGFSSNTMTATATSVCNSATTSSTLTVTVSTDTSLSISLQNMCPSYSPSSCGPVTINMYANSILLNSFAVNIIGQCGSQPNNEQVATAPTPGNPTTTSCNSWWSWLAGCNCNSGYSVVNGKCMQCTPGQYMTSSGCYTCPSGTTTLSSGTQSSCTNMCNPGYYSNNGVSPCSACPIGTYMDSTMGTQCASCPAGMTTNQVGSTSVADCVTICGPGTYSSNGNGPCQLCAQGSYNPNYSQTSCMMCPAGSTSTAGSTQCTLVVPSLLSTSNAEYSGMQFSMITASGTMALGQNGNLYSTSYPATVCNGQPCNINILNYIAPLLNVVTDPYIYPQGSLAYPSIQSGTSPQILSGLAVPAYGTASLSLSCSSSEGYSTTWTIQPTPQSSYVSIQITGGVGILSQCTETWNPSTNIYSLANCVQVLVFQHDKSLPRSDPNSGSPRFNVTFPSATTNAAIAVIITTPSASNPIPSPTQLLDPTSGQPVPTAAVASFGLGYSALSNNPTLPLASYDASTSSISFDISKWDPQMLISIAVQANNQPWSQTSYVGIQIQRRPAAAKLSPTPQLVIPSAEAFQESGIRQLDIPVFLPAYDVGTVITAECPVGVQGTLRVTIQSSAALTTPVSATQACSAAKFSYTLSQAAQYNFTVTVTDTNLEVPHVSRGFFVTKYRASPIGLSLSINSATGLFEELVTLGNVPSANSGCAPACNVWSFPYCDGFGTILTPAPAQIFTNTDLAPSAFVPVTTGQYYNAPNNPGLYVLGCMSTCTAAATSISSAASYSWFTTQSNSQALYPIAVTNGPTPETPGNLLSCSSQDSHIIVQGAVVTISVPYMPGINVNASLTITTTAPDGNTTSATVLNSAYNVHLSQIGQYTMLVSTTPLQAQQAYFTPSKVAYVLNVISPSNWTNTTYQMTISALNGAVIQPFGLISPSDFAYDVLYNMAETTTPNAVNMIKFATSTVAFTPGAAGCNQQTFCFQSILEEGQHGIAATICQNFNNGKAFATAFGSYVVSCSDLGAAGAAALLASANANSSHWYSQGAIITIGVVIGCVFIALIAFFAYSKVKKSLARSPTPRNDVELETI